MMANQWKQYQEKGIASQQNADKAKLDIEKCVHYVDAGHYFSKAYDQFSRIRGRSGIASASARCFRNAAVLLRQQQSSQEQTKEIFNKAIKYYDLALNGETNSDAVNNIADQYTKALTESLDYALHMSEADPKQAVWFIETLMRNIRRNDLYPHMTFHCALHIARIWENRAQYLLTDGNFAKAMGMLRHARMAMEEVKTHHEYMGNAGATRDMEKVDTKIEDYFSVAKSMQKMDNARCLLTELSGSSSKKTVQIAHEIIDLFRSAFSLADGKHTKSMYAALIGIADVYRNVLGDINQANVYTEKANKIETTHPVEL